MCVLCHVELHSEDWEIASLEYKHNPKPDPRYRGDAEKQCPYCQSLFVPQSEKQKYCCLSCSVASRSNRPSIEELAQLVEQFSNVEIGKQLGVTEASVRKWRHQYGLVKNRSALAK